MYRITMLVPIGPALVRTMTYHSDSVPDVIAMYPMIVAGVYNAVTDEWIDEV